MTAFENIYATPREHVLQAYGAHISGNASGLFISLSSKELASAARNALQKSAEALGYGPDGVTFVQLHAQPEAPRSEEVCRNISWETCLHLENGGQTGHRDTNDSAETIRSSLRNDCLSKEDVFLLLEGCDPICMVACDGESACALAQAYRIDMPPMPAARIFGRETRLFEDLDSQLKTPEGKQFVWAALKTLPRFGR